MITNVYRIANKNIQVTSEYIEVHNLCRNYLTDGAPDLFVKVGPDDICFERQRSESMKHGYASDCFSDAYLETLAIYRQIAEQMIRYDTLLFHGSVVAVDGNAFLFAAKSGTGKSTHTALWRKYFGNRAVMVNDDKPLLRIDGNSVIACGTPWNGKHNIGNNIALPLKAICFIRRDKENHIEPVSRSVALPLLFRYAYKSSNKENAAKSIEILNKILTYTKAYSLGCNMDISAVTTAYNRIKDDLSEDKR